MVALRTILVAAVEGVAVGAGARLHLAADLRIAGAEARVSFGGAATGLAFGTWGLPGLVGWGRAMDLCLTGRSVSAEEAAQTGLVDRVETDPMSMAVELTTALAAAPAGAVADVKRLVRGRGGGRPEDVARERAANADRVHVEAGSRDRDPWT